MMNESCGIIQGKVCKPSCVSGHQGHHLIPAPDHKGADLTETDQLDLKMKNSFLSAQLHLSLTMFPLKGSGYACCSIGQPEAFILLPFSTPRLTLPTQPWLTGQHRFMLSHFTLVSRRRLRLLTALSIDILPPGNATRHADKWQLLNGAL